MSRERIYQDVRTSSEGLAVTTYRTNEDGEPIVEDESWWTWAELEKMREDNDPDY